MTLPMKKLTTAIIFIVLLFISCNKEEIKTDPDNPLLGIWNYSNFQDNMWIYTRNLEFIDNHCYEFKNDGTLIERKNSGWCGTPPITYADYPGTWSLLNDTLVQIEVGYWGGTASYKLDIESVDSKFLKATIVEPDK
jgi:hypothetical protein